MALTQRTSRCGACLPLLIKPLQTVPPMSTNQPSNPVTKLGTCVCRLRGDPIIEQYLDKFELVEKANQYVLTEVATGDCRMKVEVMIGKYGGEGGLVIPKWLRVTYVDIVVQLNENFDVEVGR